MCRITEILLTLALNTIILTHPTRVDPIYIYTNYPQDKKLRKYKIEHLLASGTFNAHL